MTDLSQTPKPPATAAEHILTACGLKLLVEKRIADRQLQLSLRTQTHKHCILHWGIRRTAEPQWHIPPPNLWPEGTTAANRQALQTPFKKQNGESQIDITLTPVPLDKSIEFVLYFPDENRWDNNNRHNYQVTFPAFDQTGSSPLDALKNELARTNVLSERVFEIENAGQLAVGVTKPDSLYRVLLLSNVPGLLALHWGIARRSPHEWLQPPENLRPPGTILCEGHSTQTPFSSCAGFNRLILEFPESDAPLGVQFVLRTSDDSRWLKHRGGNFYVPIHAPPQQSHPLNPAELTDLAQRIIRAEMGPSSWTLMHRFNLCHELLDEAVLRPGGTDALALLYVWLRFSAIRQLTWQRNYNTKPRELAHAQDRLTGKLAEFYRSHAGCRALLRLMLATVGRGGEGQRIRDEILQIMHRHHIKEVSGHFLEEWHQKLHNNTTPDDIVICEAYLDFLRHDGNRDRFYQTLQNGGVTRQRLESFERPIRTHPDFVPRLKNALIHDFEDFLKILNATHASTDLETAINSARNRLDPDTEALVWKVWRHRNDPPDALVCLVRQITEIRRRLSHQFEAGNALRALLYLDLALEQLVRVAVERNLHLPLPGDAWVGLVGAVLENVTLSQENPELAACLRHWEQLQPLPRFNVEWSLHAHAVVDRIARALGAWTDRFYQLLQPKAELLGHGFNAESWTVTLFSEEVVRGSSLGFVLSMLLHHLGRLLRKTANLGPWQIVSRGQGTGRIEVVPALRSIQGRPFPFPTVIVTDKVTGDEDIPDQIVGVIAPDVTDLVSHVAVRARNAQVLFASCADSAMLDRLKLLRGRRIHVTVTAAGDVVFEQPPESGPAAGGAAKKPPRLALVKAAFTRYAVTRSEFNEKNVGRKTLAQEQLRGKLPGWVRQPLSVCVPFGVAEKVLSLSENAAAARHCAELIRTAHPARLAPLREAIQALAAPEALHDALRAAFREEGLAWPDDWPSVWRCITQVWASKWNERAVLSRNRAGIPHADLSMAVLIQPVIEAQYAFVMHTTNPSTGNADDLYAEVVLGLGETLVGNHPGRALAFTANKSSAEFRLLTFPSKSFGLYGAGLIFRSDSNAEDLPGYAGAGLYDSVLLPPPRQMRLDYADEPLVWDNAFRQQLVHTITQLGVTIEKIMGAPQDIEGAIVNGEYFLLQTRPQV